MEKLPSAKLPQKASSALSEGVVLPDNLDLFKVIFYGLGFDGIHHLQNHHL